MPSSMHIFINPDCYLGRLRQSLDIHIGDLRNTLRSIEDGSYAEKAGTPHANALIRMQLSIGAGQDLGAAATAACNDCFLRVTRELIVYLDRMIAIKRCKGRSIRTPHDLPDTEARRSFIEGIIDLEYQQVASDRALTNPKKISVFPKLADLPRKAALSYFAIRRALEHYSGVASGDLSLITLRLSVLADGQEITALPCQLPRGTQISLSIEEAAKGFTQSSRIVLSEEDLEQVCFTIQYLIAPDVRRALIS